MKRNGPKRILDSDVFITAKNSYYAFSFCPGFWESLTRLHEEGLVFSLDRVRKELVRTKKKDDPVPEEDLSIWVRKAPRGFFLRDTTEAVGAYEDVIAWTQARPYKESAKDKFAGGADGWLIAHAMVSGYTVVTQEQSAPQSRSAIKIPDVCKHFDVKCENTFDLLRSVDVRLDCF